MKVNIKFSDERKLCEIYVIHRIQAREATPMKYIYFLLDLINEMNIMQSYNQV